MRSCALRTSIDDDRDVIITNLLESYDRPMAFGKKHLSDPFVMGGDSEY